MKFQLRPFAVAVLQLAVISGLLYTLYTISTIILYAIIALYISILLRPVVDLLGRSSWGSRLGNGAKAAIVLVGFLVLISAIGASFLPAFISEFTFLSQIDYTSLLASLQGEWNTLNAFLMQMGIETQKELDDLGQSLSNVASVDLITGTFTGLIGGLGNLLIAAFSIVFLSFFLIKDRWLAPQFTEKVLPPKYFAIWEGAEPKVKTTVTRYSVGILIQISAIFILLSLGLTLIGVPGAVVLALFAAVFNLIPYIGPLVGAFFGILLSLGQLYSLHVTGDPSAPELLTSLYLLMGLFLAVQLLDNTVFQPLIFSNSVGVHPIEIFLVISIAGTVFGIGGMVFAVPVYSIIRIVTAEIASSIPDGA